MAGVNNNRVLELARLAKVRSDERTIVQIGGLAPIDRSSRPEGVGWEGRAVVEGTSVILIRIANDVLEGPTGQHRSFILEWSRQS